MCDFGWQLGDFGSNVRDGERGREQEKDMESERRGKRLTLTSAFLFRRLLAAAERQNDTPSDGRVHIIHPLMRPRLPESVHSAAGAARMHGLRVCLLIRAPRLSENKVSTPISPHVGTFSWHVGREPGREIFPPSEKEKSSLYPVKSTNNSIQLAPPHPTQLAKALDKQRTWGKRGGKSQTNSAYNPNTPTDRCTHRHRQRRGLGWRAWGKWRCRYVIMGLLISRVGWIRASSLMGRTRNTFNGAGREGRNSTVCSGA